MDYIYAALLLDAAGKKVEEKSLTKVLESAGIKVEPARIKALLAALEGVDIKEVISKSASLAVAAPAGEAKPAAEAKEEKEEEEVSEEEAAAGLGALFG